MTIFTRLFFLLLTPVFCMAQNIAADSTILTPADFIAIVKKFHPVIKLADINVEKAKAAIVVARGGFDPLAYVNSTQKTFDGKNYYQYTNPELKIPTWYGIELKAGLENNGGQYLNSESTEGKTSYVGISIPLAKNLLMDNRRAVLQQAKIFRQQSESEKINTINDLLFEAYESYWNWVKEYQSYKILSDAVIVNEKRFMLVKIGYRQGGRPAIDTIEALAQLQNFQFLQNESWVKYKNAGVALSTFLWLENNAYYQLNEKIIPDNKWNLQSINEIGLGVLDEILYTASFSHPKLSIYSFKLQGLEIERKLKFQSLLPAFNVKANLLNRGYDVWKGVGPGFYQNNNKFGFDIGLPLRLSEGRGAYKLAKLKINETNYARIIQQQEIENKIRNYFNELAGLQRQIDIYEKAYSNYQTLFRGEDIRFSAGESTLFLLNTRENKVLEALQKLTDLKAKFYKTQVEVQWAAGQLR
jgi:outer membrane protein TolC